MSLFIQTDEFRHNAIIEDMQQIISSIVEKKDSKNFFRVMACYHLCRMASSMRVKVNSKFVGKLPTNFYCFLVANSGFGKTRSNQIFEEKITNRFDKQFKKIMKDVCLRNMINEAKETSQSQSSKAYEDAFKRLEIEMASYGQYEHSFEDATVPAYRQIRSLCQLSGIGSTNLSIDEIGDVIVDLKEIITVYVKVYDTGSLKNKILKNTTLEKRYTRDSKVPANMIMMGTEEKIKIKEANEVLKAFFASGLARRTNFALGIDNCEACENSDVDNLYELACKTLSNTNLTKYSYFFESFANQNNYKKIVSVEDDADKLLFKYKLWCKERAKEEVDKNGACYEMANRYIRALKISGAIAFFSNSDVTIEIMQSCLLLLEEQGEDFSKIISCDDDYKIIAEYICSSPIELTHSDLMDKFDNYPESKQKRKDLFTLINAYCYKNDMLIKKRYFENVELLSGQKFQLTDVDKLITSYSQNDASNYKVSFLDQVQFKSLCTNKNWFFSNHHFNNEHRSEENLIKGFNYIVLDLDGEISLEKFHSIFKGYYYISYTTKSHTNEIHRFRVILPILYTLFLTYEEYKSFVKCLYSNLPFKIKDESGAIATQRWSTFNGKFYRNDGQLINPIPFLNSTTKNDKMTSKGIYNLKGLEKFYASQFFSGNRNKTLIKYALTLMDLNMTYEQIKDKVMKFNSLMINRVKNSEIEKTILKTIQKKINS